MENINREQLTRPASPAQLEQAAAFNHTELFCINAMSVGGEVHQTGGVTWTHGGQTLESMIAFPVLKTDKAGEVLDEIIQYYLGHPPTGAGCWSLAPSQPEDLEVMLLARGFQPGWHPNWLALDLATLDTNHTKPADLEVVADNNTPLDNIMNLPYGNTDIKVFSQQQTYASSVLQRFVARLNDTVVAHCSVLLTTGPLGAAGIYHVGVVPFMQNRGIGKAVVGAACKYAKEQGYHYALLNGTGYKMYEQLGFKRLGKGNTWWLVTSRLLAYPPSKNGIRLAEAIGRGDMVALEITGRELPDPSINTTLTNGMTLMQLAVHCRQPASAEWLIAHGLPINVMDAWNLGWTERAANILTKDPDQANLQHGERGLTILHAAVERGDIKLATLALSAKPDPEVKDKLYKSTALEWARHLKKKEMIRLIENNS